MGPFPNLWFHTHTESILTVPVCPYAKQPLIRAKAFHAEVREKPFAKELEILIVG